MAPDTVPVRLLDLLSATARELVEALDASACAISRAIGDVLILVAEFVTDQPTLQQGQGFLVTDYPLTEEVLTERVARALTVADPDADEAEVKLLHELGFGSLLMLPLELAGKVWGLVEVYRNDTSGFTEEQIDAASAIVAGASARM